MSYPLPGETITRTLQGVEFDCARPRDEPAPPQLAELFREMQTAFVELGSAHQQWREDRSPAAFVEYRHSIDYYESMHAALLRALRRRPDRCYTCDGHRFWLFTEPGGCRRNIIRIEEV